MPFIAKSAHLLSCIQFKNSFWKYKVWVRRFKVKGENRDFTSARAGFAFFFNICNVDQAYILMLELLHFDITGNHHFCAYF